MKKNIQALTTLAIIWIWCQKHYFDIHSSSFDTCPIAWLRLWNFIMNQVELTSVLHSNKPLKRIFWYLVRQLRSDCYELGTFLHNNFFWKSTKLKRLINSCSSAGKSLECNAQLYSIWLILKFLYYHHAMCTSCWLLYSKSSTLDTLIKIMLLIFAFLIIFGDIKANLIFDGEELGYNSKWVNSQVFIYKDEKFSGMEESNLQ